MNESIADAKAQEARGEEVSNVVAQILNSGWLSEEEVVVNIVDLMNGAIDTVR